MNRRLSKRETSFGIAFALVISKNIVLIWIYIMLFQPQFVFLQSPGVQSVKIEIKHNLIDCQHNHKRGLNNCDLSKNDGHTRTSAIIDRIMQTKLSSLWNYDIVYTDSGCAREDIARTINECNFAEISRLLCWRCETRELKGIRQINRARSLADWLRTRMGIFHISLTQSSINAWE